MKKRALSTFPRSPKVICTFHGYANNEALKIWAAENVERGAKLLIAQHGGAFGMLSVVHKERHQRAVADRFVTWGWDDSADSKTLPLPSPKLARAKKDMVPTSGGDALLVLTAYPRFPFSIESMPQASQWLSYIDDQLRFMGALSERARPRTRIRLYSHQYGWPFRERFVDAGFESQIDDSSVEFGKSVCRSSICVVSYNATTYLESFVADFPTLLFWNPRHWELREQARPYFRALEEAGILFHRPEDAAAQLNRVIGDPQAWWQSEEVQRARRDFCRQFARADDGWPRKWRRALDEIMATSKEPAWA